MFGQSHKSQKRIGATLKWLPPKLPCRMRCMKSTRWICWHGETLHGIKLCNNFQWSCFDRRNRQDLPSVNSVRLDIWVVGASGSCRVCRITSWAMKYTRPSNPREKMVGMSQVTISTIMTLRNVGNTWRTQGYLNVLPHGILERVHSACSGTFNDRCQ